jgi:DNA-binding GntR family transcriptional regulator
MCGPAYQQFAVAIREQVESGELAPGDQLPTKRELISQHNVSEQVIAMAMVVPCTEGWIEVRQGKGVYVAERPPQPGRSRV